MPMLEQHPLTNKAPCHDKVTRLHVIRRHLATFSLCLNRHPTDYWRYDDDYARDAMK
jgi:hypothetical protein